MSRLWESLDGLPPLPEPPDSFFDSGPDWCHLCEGVIEGDGVLMLCDLDPADPETGPQPDIQEVLVHGTCADRARRR